MYLTVASELRSGLRGCSGYLPFILWLGNNSLTNIDDDGELTSHRIHPQRAQTNTDTVRAYVGPTVVNLLQG